ncbi:MAG: hypothetical protein COA49_01970 [Bacteroidetes bacterium]|nr:MAG: hypothetical protein COA49_01970 [Bacteroidota bacterium]
MMVQVELEVKSIELSGLVLGYKGMPNLTLPISTEFKGPGIHALVGGNGAGKSTLIRTILGLQDGVEGEVLYGGDKVRTLNYSEKASIFSFVGSTPPKSSGLKVKEVLNLAVEMSRSNIAPDVFMSIIKSWSLQNLLSRRLDTLSDGQASRVMFARAETQGASWMFLDEPTAFLDIPARKQLISMLKEFSQNKSVIIATHDLHALAELNPIGVYEVGDFGLKTLTSAGKTESELVVHWEEKLG